MRDHCRDGAYKLIYADTGDLEIHIKSLIFSKDSIAIATTQTGPLEGSREQRMKAIFGPMLKPSMVKNFYEKWSEWFVLTDLVEDLRKPGLLKSIIFFSKMDY